MDRTLEKIELARELGMSEYVHKNKISLQEQEEICRLTSMNFKPTNPHNIKKMICKRVWHGFLEKERYSWGGTSLSGSNVVWIVPLAAAFLFAFCVVATSSYQLTEIRNALFVVLAICAVPIIGWIISRFKKCELKDKSLNSWSDNIPYGGLLAVKEAKEAGLDNFEIYYPTKQEVRYVADPVIVGYSKGVMFEVFAWDDGKVYE